MSGLLCVEKATNEELVGVVTDDQAAHLCTSQLPYGSLEWEWFTPAIRRLSFGLRLDCVDAWQSR
jgi:hypothetical protein